MRKVSTLFMILIIGVMFISCDSTTENNEIDVKIILIIFLNKILMVYYL